MNVVHSLLQRLILGGKKQYSQVLAGNEESLESCHTKQLMS